jgi:hypothetical protein
MALDDFEIKHQPYIKFLTSTSTKEGVYKVGIDSDLTMKEMLDNLIEELRILVQLVSHHGELVVHLIFR